MATIPELVRDVGAGALVTDLAVLRLGREWREKVSSPLVTVDDVCHACCRPCANMLGPC